VAASTPAVTDRPTAAASSVASAPAADLADEAMEVCGVGRVSRRQLEDLSLLERGKFMAQMYLLERRKDTAMSRLAARLSAGSDREQVAARLLMNDGEGAALIAHRTTDATAYRLAMQGCGKWSTGPGCTSLSVDAWARLDPADARPWLQWMAEAVQRKDDAAATTALEQVLQRRRVSPMRLLEPAVAGAYASVDDDVGRGLAVIDVVGREAAFVQLEFVIMGRYCSAEALKDASRREHCGRLVRWQFQHADSAAEGAMAVGLADRLGLPASERPYTREQLEKGLKRMSDDAGHVGELDCSSLARAADWSGRRVQSSELQQALQAADKP